MNDLRKYLLERCTGANDHHLSAGDHYVSGLHFPNGQRAFHNGFRVFINDLILCSELQEALKVSARVGRAGHHLSQAVKPRAVVGIVVS
jgi:hypothetical protein